MTSISGVAAMAELLRIDNVTAGYADADVLEAISLALDHEEWLVVLGRNGVGKTTLLATVMGLTRLRGGRLYLEATEITRLETHERALLGIGYVPQEREIFPSLSVEEHLGIAARPGRWTPELVYDLFPRLAERRRNGGARLSGGEQQMLAVGRALVGNPRLLLLDEPFEGLAPLIVDQLAAALERLRRESRMALVLVEHRADLALGICRRAVVLDRGRVVWQGMSDVLRRDEAALGALVGLEERPAAGTIGSAI